MDALFTNSVKNARHVNTCENEKSKEKKTRPDGSAYHVWVTLSYFAGSQNH